MYRRLSIISSKDSVITHIVKCFELTSAKQKWHYNRYMYTCIRTVHYNYCLRVTVSGLSISNVRG